MPRSIKRRRSVIESSPRPEGRVVAITGAFTFIGAALIRRLEADPSYRKILAIDLRKPTQPLRKTEFHKINLMEPTADDDLAALFQRHGVDTVVHAAFLSEPTHNTTWAHELESIGTMHVLNAVGEARVGKLLLASTTLVYGPSPLNPNFLDERSELRGHRRSSFINDKVEAERQTLRFAKENPDTVVTSLRLATQIGPTVRNFATRVLARPICPRLMGYDPLFQLLHESDAIEAFLLALDGSFRGPFNIVGDGVLPYSTVLALAGRIPLPMPRFIAYPISQALWMTQVFDSPPNFLDFLRYLCVADGARAKREMGFAPRYDIRATIASFLGDNVVAEVA